MTDAVLSYHTDPYCCGVAKFSAQLAQRLGVPFDQLAQASRFRHPLLSVKCQELIDNGAVGLHVPPAFDLFLHDAPRWDVPLFRTLVERATTVYAGNHAIAENVATVRPDRICAWCPSTIVGNSTRPGLAILSFGMAHKFQAPLFEKLKTLLDASQHAYTMAVSTGIHEGSPWHVTTRENEAMLRDIFGEHLRFLGFLTDDGLAREIRDAHMVALFYDPAVRANNTTLWAALDAGTPVITNLDAQSPPELIHNGSVFDLAQLTEWPEANLLRQVRWGGRKAAEAYSWDAFLAKLQAVHA